MKLNIQLFASGTINGSSTASLGRIKIEWSSTPSDAINNKSSVTATVYIWRSTNYDTNGTFSGTLTINGNSVSISKKRSNWNTTPKDVGSYTVDVPHNEDGSKTCNISVRLTQTGTSLAGTYTANADVVLDTIPRASAFNSFTMSVNNDSSISVVASITKRNSSFTDTLNICNEDITLNDGTNYITFSRNEHLTAYNRFYQLMGNQTQANYTAVLTTSSSGSQIGNTSALTAYNVALPNYALSISTITSSDDNANNYIRSGSTYKVSDFTSTNTFLQGFSNPRLSYSLGATYNTLYGNAINISGAGTRSGLSLGNDSFTLGTNFTGGTKTLNVSDGRKSTSGSITLTRKDWATPSVSITLVRQSATGQQINWSISYSYTSVSGGITPKLSATYTYNETTYTIYNNQTLTNTSGTLTGSFNLVNADDYKYPISANATLTDTIDYLVQSNIQITGGLPAIYTHKDNSANNLVDIYGKLDIENPAYINSNGETFLRYNASKSAILSSNGSELYLRPNGTNNSTGQVYIDTSGNITGNLIGNISGNADGSSNRLANTDTGTYSLTYAQRDSSYYGSDSGWAHYIICNHGDGATYFNYMIRLPFWGSPQYQHQDGSTSARTGWIPFKTLDNSCVAVMKGMTGDMTLSNGTLTKLNMTGFNTTGWSKFTASNNGIKIGGGVSKVLVSGQAYFTTMSGSKCITNLYIHINSVDDGHILARAVQQSNYNYQTVSISPVIVDVNENDIIYLSGKAQDSNMSVSKDGWVTYLCVQQVQ